MLDIGLDIYKNAESELCYYKFFKQYAQTKEMETRNFI